VFFQCGFTYFQEPFAAASMARRREANQGEYKLITAFFALPSPVAIHLHISGKRLRLGFQNPRTRAPTKSSSAGGAPNGSILPSELCRLPDLGAEMYAICPASARDAKNASAVI
jgi:hypothetical protein